VVLWGRKRPPNHQKTGEIQLNKNVNVELVQQQEEINRLKKERNSLRIGLFINHFLTAALIIAVVYLYYIKAT